MKKHMMKRLWNGSLVVGLLATFALPTLASTTSIADALTPDAGLAPLLALGLSALFYLRSSSDM